MSGSVTNALLLPGLGSIVAGRWISGILQVLSSFVGFGLTMVWAASWMRSVLADGTLPVDLGPDLRRGAFGLLLFAFSWLWSLVSGVLVVREARATHFLKPR